MKLTRIRISNYRGIATCDEQISPAGAIVHGANARGKTTVLNAIRAALAGRDIGPDAIRNGSDKAEIIVDLEDISVRRAITSKQSSLTVTKDSFKAAKPQAFLTELLGTSPLDPLELFLAKPKERRAQVLAALPVEVTVAQLRKWVPDLPESTDVRGHGLEVLDRIRSGFYEARTRANKLADEQKRLAADALAALPPEDAAGPTVDAARAELDAARAATADLKARARAADEAAKRSESTRTRLVALRSEADGLEKEATAEKVDAMDLDDQHERVTSGQAAIAKLEEQLEAARAALATEKEVLAKLEKRIGIAAAATARATALRTQAADLEGAIAQGAEAPTQAELDAARDRQHAAEQASERAAERAETALARERANGRQRDATEAAAEATRLDGIVKALANDAPSALLAATSAIPGLRLDGDDIFLDDVRLDALCGAEQMKFAVEIAKRLNAKSKILVVDGLERLDPEQREDFVRHATSGGFQLLGTLVDRGEPVFAAIAPSEPAEAAAE